MTTKDPKTYNTNESKEKTYEPAGHSDGNADEFMHGRGDKSAGNRGNPQQTMPAQTPKSENQPEQDGRVTQGTGGGSRNGSPNQPREDQGILQKGEYSGDKEGQEQGPDEEEGYDPPGTHNTPK